MVSTKNKKGKPIIKIHLPWCKGCGVCVEFCPKDVLELRDSKAFVVREEDCIACMQCELLCPDFGITVEITGE